MFIFLFTMDSYFLGIDIGTGSTKAVAVDYKGKTLYTCQVHYQSFYPHPGHVEQRPEDIFKAFVQCISDAVRHLIINPSAICLSSAMHSIIPVDKGGHALANMLTWADARSASIAEKIILKPVAKRIYETTGTPIHAMSPLCKIIWWRDNDPELFLNTHKFISIKEFIWYKLFHHFHVDHSVASATGLFDIINLKWSEEAMELAGITENYLSKPVSTGYVRYDLPDACASALHIDADTPFVIGGSDGCLANLGSSVMQDGIAAITVGTSGAVRTTSKKPIIDVTSMLFNYRLDEHHFVCGGAINNGGIALKWYTDNFFQNKSEEGLDALLQSVNTVEAGSEGLLFLPYLMGERAPIWDSRATGAFIGIHMGHKTVHFLRSILEGICYSLYQVLLNLEKDYSGPIEKIHASGGLFQSKITLQLLADITGKKVHLMQTGDASAIGAVFLGLKALEYVDNFEALPKQEVIETATPDMELHAVYKKYFAVYLKLYDNLKDPMHQLQAMGK